MEIIGIQASLEPIKLVTYIHSLFSSKALLYWVGNSENTFVYNGVEHIESKEVGPDFSGFALHIESNKSEFPTHITLSRTAEEHSEERSLFLALKLAEEFNCKTIIDAPKRLADHPYLSLVLDNGKIYEADDMGSVWADGEGGEVKIIREIQLERPDFDANGNLKK